MTSVLNVSVIASGRDAPRKWLVSLHGKDLGIFLYDVDQDSVTVLTSK